VSETRFARSGDGHVAYQVIGDGPTDLVLAAGWFTHVEAIWENREAAQFLESLASFTRLILFDKRGVGLSDPVPLGALPTLEEWMDDVRAVLDAVGSTSTVLFGSTDGGILALLFAATYPDRTRGLILLNAYPRLLRDVDYPAGMPAAVGERLVRGVEEAWTTEDSAALEVAFPASGGERVDREWFRHYLRLAASPGTAAAMQRLMLETDVRPVLPTVRVPTLVLHRRGNQLYRVGHGRYLAEHIPGARYIELDGVDQTYYRHADQLLDEMRELVTGVRAGPPTDRVLATVLFTDIVDSTSRAREIGDQRWRVLLDQYDGVVRRQLERFRGREVKFTGDGTLATFDGPGRAIQCALAISQAVEALGLRIRAGLHAGEIEMRGTDVTGIAVVVGQRVSALARGGEVLVSRTVRDLVAGSGIRFADRGDHDLKGIDGSWQVFAVQPGG
jgi:class 3 adenylate cyclase